MYKRHVSALLGIILLLSLTGAPVRAGAALVTAPASIANVSYK